jgi:hypothetical protein
VRRALAVPLILFACDPPATPAQTPTPTPTQTQAPTQNIDVRVELESTSDAYSSYISAFLTIPAMNVHVQLFAVPFPYQCSRGETDAGDGLAVECRGDDGKGSASVRLDHGHVVAIAHDYARITADKTVKDFTLPPNTTATIYAPAKFPEAH